MKKLIVMLVAVALFAPLVASARSFQLLPIIELVKGCTNKAGLNYNPKANQDDGSCVYPEANFVSSSPSDYALNSFGRVYNGDETEVGTLPSGTWYVRPASYFMICRLIML